jgi:hypothetical protein
VPIHSKLAALKDERKVFSHMPFCSFLQKGIFVFRKNMKQCDIEQNVSEWNFGRR